MFFCVIQVCGASDDQELPPNFVKLAKDAYTPDLIAASDCMLGQFLANLESFDARKH